MSTASYDPSPGQQQRVMGEVEERVWTCIAADTQGVVDEEKIGMRTLQRRVAFAFRAEAEAWAEAQRSEGFEIVPGPTPYATRYHGPTDSPSNCWSVCAEKAVAA